MIIIIMRKKQVHISIMSYLLVLLNNVHRPEASMFLLHAV